MARKRNPFGGDDDGGDGMDGGGRYMVPYGGGMGPMVMIRDGGHQRPVEPQRHAEEPPARVLLALEYIKLAKQIEAKRVIPYQTKAGMEGQEGDVKILDGMKLTPDESATQAAAAGCLADYFMGKMPPNVWEQADLVPTPTAEMNCLCIDETGRPATACPFCSGTGKMVLVLNPARIQMQSIGTAVRSTETTINAATPARSKK